MRELTAPREFGSARDALIHSGPGDLVVIFRVNASKDEIHEVTGVLATTFERHHVAGLAESDNPLGEPIEVTHTSFVFASGESVDINWDAGQRGFIQIVADPAFPNLT